MLKINHFDVVTRFDMARDFIGRRRYWTTAYLVDGMMMDTGYAHSAPELIQALSNETVVRIVNTHSHEDHIGANGHLQHQRDTLEILAQPLALPILADPRGKQSLQFYRRMFWGWPEPSRGQPVADQALIKTEHYCFRVVYTPGHSPDHLCLYESEQGWLFTGDLFVGGRDRATRADYDIWQIIASLKQIAMLPAVKLFPGSAQVRENPKRELDAKISYLEDLGEQVLEFHQQGWEVQEIVRTLCGGPMLVELFTLGHFSRRRLILSYLGKNDQN